MQWSSLLSSDEHMVEAIEIKFQISFSNGENWVLEMRKRVFEISHQWKVIDLDSSLLILTVKWKSSNYKSRTLVFCLPPITFTPLVTFRTPDDLITGGLVYLVHATLSFFGIPFYWDPKIDPISRKMFENRRFLPIQ